MGDHKKQLEHHKLTPRGEACIYLGLGFSRGYKGWVCFNPENNRIYCTRHVVFDETFMPARTQDQRILSHYDTTPRTRIPTLIHGTMEDANRAYEEINTSPLVTTLEMIDELEASSEEDLQQQPCGRLEHPEADFGLQMDHETDTIDEMLRDIIEANNAGKGAVVTSGEGGNSVVTQADGNEFFLSGTESCGETSGCLS